MSHNRLPKLFVGFNGLIRQFTVAISSRSSIEIYKSLKDDIINLIKAALHELFRDAEKIIKQTFEPDPQHTYTHRKGDETASVDLDKAMNAMLEHAEECGGVDARRYVASAIVVCGLKEDVVKILAALGVTRLTHLSSASASVL